MDHSATYSLPATSPPSIPRHGRHNRRGLVVELEDPCHTAYGSHPANARSPHARNESVAPASPEVISSLITSLSAISEPATAHFDLPLDLIESKSNSPSKSPVARRAGSFGVEYGAFPTPTSSGFHDDKPDLDELAAAPPVVKTAKPPSGFSPLTAPKSPKSESGGLRSLLSGSRNTSRPSSRSSSASKDADVVSTFGTPSLERGLSPSSSPSQVKKTRSQENWSKKASRSQKGLMYMSSKERLRENEERKRSASSNGLASSAMARTTDLRPDAFLSQTITEEPSSFDDWYPTQAASSTNGSSSSPRSIPQRDSSLRQTGQNAKRSSARSSRTPRRDSEHDPIPEEDYFNIGVARTKNTADPVPEKRSSYKAGQRSRSTGDGTKEKKSQRLLDPSWATTAKSNHYIDHYVTDTEAELEESAPAPSIAQGKRRDREVSRDRSSRRRSGRSTPEPRVKRSNSKMKRLSGTLSPRNDDKGRDSGTDTNTNSVSYERPPSADSVDDAVEAFLRSQRLSQKIRHPQTGRVISFSEVGDPDGSAVFCCVGMGLTRYIMAFYDELALTLKLRLITPDRPGVGDSEAYADGTATPLSWPDDVYAICQVLRITKFSILAHSAGAIYALATALRMPQHIRGRIHLLAPWIPPSQMSVFGASAQAPLPPTNPIPTSQKILRALPTPILKAANSSFMSATSSSITSSLPKNSKKTKRKPSSKDKENASNRNSDRPTFDRQIGSKAVPDAPELTMEMFATEEMDQVRPDGASPTAILSPMSAAANDRYRNSGSNSIDREEEAIIAAAESAMAERQRQESYDMRLTQAIWELATTGANPAVDLLVCLERRHTIGFRYVDITRPVVIHHGSRDTRVPVDNVKWLGKMMRRCEVRVLEGESHGLMASAAVMGTVLMEISKEWEDWNKATGQNLPMETTGRRVAVI